MLSDKLKARIKEQDEKLTNQINLENEAARKEQEKKLTQYQKLIESLKNTIIDIAEGRKNIKNREGYGIFITDTQKVFSSSGSAAHVFYHSYAKLDFFEAYNKLGFHEESNKFKQWLDENGIKSIVTTTEHDGGGIRGWVSYYADLKD